MAARIRDFALLVAHAWRCTRCREGLLQEPVAACVGFKLDEEQRAAILKLTDDSFHTVNKLAECTGLTVRELDEAIDHPRARLRHLAGDRYDFQFARY